jgi:hypothetical protein
VHIGNHQEKVRKTESLAVSRERVYVSDSMSAFAALLVLGPFAFQPAPATFQLPRSVRTRHSEPFAALLADGEGLANSIRIASALPTMYALMSVNEYMTHRYFQHLEFNKPDSLPWLKRAITSVIGDEVEPKVAGDGHVEHHAETYDDMSLKNDERWRRTPASKSLDEDDFRGTAFHWKATLIMTVQMLPSVLPTYALMGWSVPETMTLLLPSMLLHALVWNAIHPPMHGLPQVTAADGAPSAWLLDLGLGETEYFRYIYDNHMGHHVLGGQANYNVCCPGTDHLLGTYVARSEWSGRMRAIPANAVTRGNAVSYEGVAQPPIKDDPKYAQRGSVPALIEGGGALIADAYSEVESVPELALVE